MKPAVRIDARGLSCPVPIIKTSEAMRSIDAGDLVEVACDDPAIEFDMPAWCESQGHMIESSTVEGGLFRYLIRKRGRRGSGS
jgi:tRNA 2-thiouridine synthesizing protein A